MLNPGFTFNGQHSSDYFIVNKMNRAVSSPITTKLQTVPNRPGSYDLGRSIGVRKFSIDITIVKTAQTDYLSLLRTLAAWLVTDTPQVLVFDEEPDKTYYARLDGSTDLTETIQLGQGTITFLCADPFAYGIEQNVSISDNSTISVGGSANTQPIITATFSAAASEFKIVNQDGKYVRVVYNVSANDVLEIDATKRKITINGVVQMPALDLQSEFFNLVPGDNTLTITPTGVTTTKIEYTERWY